MAVYNGEHFIEQAIRSVLNQTYFDWELLIINDGSTDHTATIVCKFQDSRIRYFATINKGVAAARNLGLLKMRGEFFCFLDSDDIFPRDSIEARLNAFHDGIVFVDGWVKVYDSSMTSIIRKWQPNVKGRVINDLIRLNGKCFFGPTWMVKRNPNMSYRMYDELIYGEDLIFYISIAHSGEYSYIDKTILHYRCHKNSAMKNVKGLAQGYLDMKRILKKHFKNQYGLLNNFIFTCKSRKIIFLSFLREGKLILSFRYVCFGKI